MNRAVLHRLGLSVGIAIALAGCANQPETGKPRWREMPAIWTDPATGCRYFEYGEGYGSLSIRFREDGTPDCPKQVAK